MNQIILHIIDDNKTSRENLTKYFLQLKMFNVTSSSARIDELYKLQKKDNTEISSIILINTKHTSLNHTSFQKVINQLANNHKVIIMSLFDEEYLQIEAVKNGAICFLKANQSLEEIAAIIKIVGNGGTMITPALGREVLNQCKKSNSKIDNSILESFVLKNRIGEIAILLNEKVESIHRNIAEIFKSIYTSKILFND